MWAASGSRGNQEAILPSGLRKGMLPASPRCWLCDTRVTFLTRGILRHKIHVVLNHQVCGNSLRQP